MRSGVILMLTLIMLPPFQALAAKDLRSSLGEDTVEDLALMINQNNHMCAEVTGVYSQGQPGAYLVECIEFRGGEKTIEYLVDTRRGTVTRR